MTREESIKKREIARRLGVTERVLEQYLASKQAEVEDEDEVPGSLLGPAAEGVARRRSLSKEKRV